MKDESSLLFDGANVTSLNLIKEQEDQMLEESVSFSLLPQP